MKSGKLIVRDLLIIVGSVLFAIFLNKYGILDTIVFRTKDYYLLGVFVAGLFFTSIFTTAPAIAVLASFGLIHPPLTVAILGGLGAMCGDLLMFRFIKKDVTTDLDFILKKTKSKRIQHIIHLKAFRWFLTSLGAFVIASPLPDELGLALMGLSKVSIALFIPVSLIFNSIGIYVIAILARVV